MATTLIGVPPGVGDTYWCLAKLKAFRAHFGLKHVTLAIQKTQKDRALEWRDMVDFVEDARYIAFTPGHAARTLGFERKNGPLDYVLWPNAVVDRGYHLREWLADFLPPDSLDLSFPVRTEPMASGLANRIVLYASALGVNRAWFPQRRGDFWIQLAHELERAFGELPLLVGAAWDHDNSDPVSAAAQSLVGSTSLRQVAWILEHARAVVGVISGLTILANHFRVPTVAFAPDKHHERFPYTWTEDQPWYTAMRPSAMFDPSYVCRSVADVIAKKEPPCNLSASSSIQPPAVP